MHILSYYPGYHMSLVVIYTFAFCLPSHLHLPALTYSILHCSTFLAVVWVLVPCHLHILCLAFVSYFELVVFFLYLAATWPTLGHN